MAKPGKGRKKRRAESVFLVCEETGDYNYVLRRKPGGEKLKVKKYCLCSCDLNGKKQLQRQVQNNIQGVGLARQVGYQPLFGNITSDQWLTTWGKLVGRKEIQLLLAEQGVDDKPRFKKILAQLK